MRPTVPRFVALWALVSLAAACARPPAPLDPSNTADVLEAAGATAGALATCTRARDGTCARQLAELLEHAERLAR